MEWSLRKALSSCSSPFARTVEAHFSRCDTDKGASSGLYSQASAFEAFINHGNNVPLYERAVERASEALVGTMTSLLDLGCGTGKLLLPLLSRMRLAPRPRIVLVDAQPGMVQGLREAVLAVVPDAQVECVVASMEEFVTRSGDDDDEFDVCISSFAMHYCSPEKRRDVMKWIYEMCTVFVLAEFDVDDTILHRPVHDRERLEYLLQRFELGVLEYAGLPVQELVVNGFLCPVFCLNFDSGQPSGEVSLTQWTRELKESGFEDMTCSVVHPYWWSDCFMIVARSNATFDKHAVVRLDLMTVENYGSKGRGYRAKCAIAAGTVVLEERPMIVRDSEESRYKAIGRIVSLGEELASEPEAAFSYLQENGFKVGEVAHLFRRKSIFNHSCWPNCGLFGLQVRTLRDIDPGEELCFSYISGVLHSWRTAVLLLPNRFRAAHLRTIFGFACECARCKGLEASAIESAMQHMKDLPEFFPRSSDLLDCPLEVRNRILSLVSSFGGEEKHAALLPASACLTLEVEWMEKCFRAFEAYLPKGFPASVVLEEMIELKKQRK